MPTLLAGELSLSAEKEVPGEVPGAKDQVSGKEPDTSHVAPDTSPRTLTESDVLALLTETLQRDYVKDRGELELIFTRSFSPVSYKPSSGNSAQPLSLKILQLPVAGVAPSFIIRFELDTADRVIGSWQVAMQAHVWQEIWVAHSTLKRGQPLTKADVVRERRDVLNIRDALADFVANDSTLELAESVQANAPLLARMLKPKTVIRRGQAADAVVRDGALNISMKVEALEDGAPGQMIRARNPLSKRNLTGKVLDEQTILIQL